VAFDSVFWSPLYPAQRCTAPAGDEEIAWLRAALETARAGGASVWLASHIPPGIDVFSMLAAGGACEAAPVSFFTDTFTSAFLDVVRQNAQTISFSIGGHTHADDFRLYPGADGAAVPHKLVASVSPKFGDAPAFTVMRFDRVTGAALDYEVTALDAGGTWRREYAFGATYGLPDLSGGSLAALRRAIVGDEKTRAAYARAYNSGGTASGIPPASWRAYACAIDSFTPASFTSCTCGK
jgi:hypothetical protein